MKRITFGLVLLALLAGPVYAGDQAEENPYVKKRETIKKEAEAMDRQYQRTLEATRGAAPAPTKNDPWANMRGGTDASKSK
jgi:hypothetical protein